MKQCKVDVAGLKSINKTTKFNGYNAIFFYDDMEKELERDSRVYLARFLETNGYEMSRINIERLYYLEKNLPSCSLYSLLTKYIYKNKDDKEGESC